MDEGQWLAGNVGGAWRVGDTVHRATGPWTPAVHALLEFLGTRIPLVPRVHGFDDRGREILAFLPGRVIDPDTDVLDRRQIESLLRWTRTFHDAVDGFAHPGPWRFTGPDRPMIIAHNDIAPYNVCFDGTELAGVFNWDLAGPSTRLMELAFIAWNCVPLWRDTPPRSAAERLEVIAAAYGKHSATEILHAVPRRIDLMLADIPRAAAAGDPGMANLLAAGEPRRSQRSLDDLLIRLPAIAAVLDGPGRRTHREDGPPEVDLPEVGH